MTGVAEVHAVKPRLGAAGLRGPVLATIGRGDNCALIADSPAVAVIAEMHAAKRYRCAANLRYPGLAAIVGRKDSAVMPHYPAVDRVAEIDGFQIDCCHYCRGGG